MKGIVLTAYELSWEKLPIQLQVSAIEKVLFAVPSLNRQEDASKIE